MRAKVAQGELDPEFDEENLRVPAPDHSWPVSLS